MQHNRTILLNLATAFDSRLPLVSFQISLINANNPLLKLHSFESFEKRGDVGYER